MYYTRWKDELSGCEIFDHGTGKSRAACFGQGLPFWVTLKLFCVWDFLVKTPTLDESFKSLKYFQRGKILLYYKHCKNKTTLISTVYPEGPRIGLCNMDVRCRFLTCLSDLFSEESYNDEIPNHHSYSWVQTQSDMSGWPQREHSGVYAVVCEWLVFSRDEGFTYLLLPCHLNILLTKSNTITDILLILQISESDA